MKKDMKVTHNKRGRPMVGESPKKPKSFTMQENLFQLWVDYCKKNSINRSDLIEN
jgi:hypothetical protein